MLNILILGGGSSYFLRGLICCFKEDLIVGGVVSYRDFFAEAKTLQFCVADFAIHQILLSLCTVCVLNLQYQLSHARFSVQLALE